MTNAITALILFVGILGAIGLFYRKLGKLSFWKLAGKLPEQALEHASSDPAFLLSVPSLGRTVKLYAHRDQIESSQQRFIDRYRDILPRHEFPYLSLLALLYPVAAILWMSNTPAPPMLVLGYGFANLGYLLGAAFLFPGHFRILGLDDRFPTLVAGVLFWVVGFALSTVAA
jgi:hypothetical protein